MSRPDRPFLMSHKECAELANLSLNRFQHVIPRDCRIKIGRRSFIRRDRFEKWLSTKAQE